MKTLLRPALLCLSLTICISPLSAVEIKGKVSKVEESTIVLQSDSEYLPAVGDQVEVYFEVPGVDLRATVAHATVTEIRGDSIVAKITRATGKIGKDQPAVVHSEKPTRRGPAAIPTPAASPPPPSQVDFRTPGALLFEDNFNGGSLRLMPVFGRQVMNLARPEGELEVGSMARGMLPAVYDHFRLKNFIAEFHLRKLSRDTGNGYGVVFRSDDRSGGLDWYYAVVIRPDRNKVSVLCWKNKQWKLASEFELDFSAIKAVDNTIRLQVIDQQIVVGLNGQVVAKVNDANLDREGVFGFCVESASDVMDAAYFDDLKIYAVPTESGNVR